MDSNSHDEDNDPLLNYQRSIHVEPFHRQRRIDGTLSFHEQCSSMEHIISTNGIDGQSNPTFDQGGIWKEILHKGIGQKPSTGAIV